MLCDDYKGVAPIINYVGVAHDYLCGCGPSLDVFVFSSSLVPVSAASPVSL